MVDPVVEILQKQSASKLSDMLRDVDQQIVDLQQQRRWIERAYQEKRGEKPGIVAGRIAQRFNQRDGPTSRRRRNEKRDAIVSIIAGAASGKTSLAVVHGELQDLGMESTPEAVRVLLRRMVTDGEIVRDGDDYRLPSNGSAPNGAAPDERDAPAPTLEGA